MDSKEVFIKRVLALLLIVAIGLLFRFIFSKVDIEGMEAGLNRPACVYGIIFPSIFPSFL